MKDSSEASASHLSDLLHVVCKSNAQHRSLDSPGKRRYIVRIRIGIKIRISQKVKVSVSHMLSAAWEHAAAQEMWEIVQEVTHASKQPQSAHQLITKCGLSHKEELCILSLD